MKGRDQPQAFHGKVDCGVQACDTETLPTKKLLLKLWMVALLLETRCFICYFSFRIWFGL